VLVESSGSGIERINCDESGGNLEPSSGPSLNRFDEKVPTETLAMVRCRDGEARQENHPNVEVGKAATILLRKRCPPHSAHCERVVATDSLVIIEEHEGPREVPPLVLMSMLAEPSVKCRNATSESVEIVTIAQPLDAHSVDTLKWSGLPRLIDERSGRHSGCIEHLHEAIK